MSEKKGMSSSSHENIKIANSYCRGINRRILEPHIQGQRRSCNKMVEGIQWRLKSNLIPTRDTWRAKTKPCAYQDPRKRSSNCHKRLSKICLECSIVPCTGKDQQWHDMETGQQQSWEAWCVA